MKPLQGIEVNALGPIDRGAGRPATDAVGTDVALDGRAARSARTRAALIEAFVICVRKTRSLPTVSDLAKIVGCSERTVFERFDRLNDILMAAFDKLLQDRFPQLSATELDLERARRIERCVALRSEMVEDWLPLWTVASRFGEAGLPERIARLDSLSQSQIQLFFLPELADLEDNKRQAVLLALDTALGFATWRRMRTHHRLSIEEAQATWREIVDRVLPEPRHFSRANG